MTTTPHNRITHPKVIGITGRAGSGKTTAATWLHRNHRNVVKYAFAAPLKNMAYELLRTALPKCQHPMINYYLHEAKEEPIPELGGVTARQIRQTLGTEWGRNAIHPDFWANIGAQRIESRLSLPFSKNTATTLRIVFDDVQFANEAEVIRAAGGCVIRIVRPYDTMSASTYEHASEKQDFDADLTIVNDQDVENLYRILAHNWPPTAHLPPPPRYIPKTHHRG